MGRVPAILRIRHEVQLDVPRTHPHASDTPTTLVKAEFFYTRTSIMHNSTRRMPQAGSMTAGTPTGHPLSKPIVVQIRSPRRCCQRSRVLTSADLLMHKPGA